jgi:LCP family protein required for cell wall assembly
MRIPQWFLVGWVFFSLVAAVGGGFWAYNQSQQRTREVNEITPLNEGVDLVRTSELLLGIREPEPPDVAESDAPLVFPTSSVYDSAYATATAQAVQALLAEPTVTEAPSEDSINQTSTPEATTEVAVATSPTSEPSLEPTGDTTSYEVWADPRRVNVLVLGVDQRQGERGPFPTDTMIVFSLSPATKTAAIITIPRDIWVSYPQGYGQGKINAVNIQGESLEFPSESGHSGPELAKQTVSALLSIPIHYFVMVNFDAFITFVNTIGEVEVCPQERIDDPKYPDGSYGYRHVTFEPGCQELNAERLLEYSRTRATSGGDFDRGKRQREVIFAMREQVLSIGGASALVGNAEEIWQSVQDSVRTDLRFDQLVSLALLAETIPADSIRDGAIGPGEVLDGTSPTGEQILVPIQTDITNLVSSLFQPAPGP